MKCGLGWSVVDWVASSVEGSALRIWSAYGLTNIILRIQSFIRLAIIRPAPLPCRKVVGAGAGERVFFT